jgi:hypothetical protein
MSDLPEKQVKRLTSLIQEAETNLAAAKELLISIIGDDGTVVTPKTSTQEDVTGKVIEGVFDGQVMVGPDGKNYPVPANYASKSKLLEGTQGRLKYFMEPNAYIVNHKPHTPVCALCRRGE